MAVPSDVEELMSLGKEEASRFLADECHEGNTARLFAVIDVVLTFKRPFGDTIAWCRSLVCCGDDVENFKKQLKEFDDGKICGLVWTADYVAFRCRTCSISPCMSLCEPCFRLGDHTNHDWNFFFSQAGGACDCGDVYVMKESGFCKDHGHHAGDKNGTKSVPKKLICVAEAIMPKLILWLIQLLRLHNNTPDAKPAIDKFIEFLHELSSMGSVMRRVMAAALIDQAVYKHLVDPDREDNELLRQSHQGYLEAVHSLPFPEVPPRFQAMRQKLERKVHLTFLEELNFWIVKMEFPQRIVCLLLNLFTDAVFKEAMTEAFIIHYSRIAVILARSAEPDPLSNRVVHVSVQVFSNENFAKKMTKEYHLLHVMIIGLRHMLGDLHIDSAINYREGKQNPHKVIDCETRVMKDHCYWPLVSDLNNVLSHKDVAFTFLEDPNLLSEWLDLLSLMQGMNLNKREMERHVEFEPSTYYAAFSAELEASAYPMWSLVSHLTDAGDIDLTKRVLRSCLDALERWFAAIGLTVDSEIDSLQMSFHWPLHRFYAAFLCQALKQGAQLHEIMPSSDTLKLIMTHPLRTQVAYYEIVNNLWVRNGLQIKGQAMTYAQCNFCNSMVDADIFLLQVCASQLDPSTVLEIFLKNFRVHEWLSLSPKKENDIFTQSDEHRVMMEGFFTFLGIVFCTRASLRPSDDESSQRELVTLLCMGDKTHSQLMDLMPERCISNTCKDLESEIVLIAEYKEPVADPSGALQHGIFTPKAFVWEDKFDPLHIALRAIQKKDVQTAMDNFTKYTEQTYKIKNPWPPYRLPQAFPELFLDPRVLVGSKTMHATLFASMFHALKSENIPEHILSLVIFILEMAVEHAMAQKSGNEICQQFTQPSGVVFDLDVKNWFQTDNLSANLKTYIEYVVIPEVVPPGIVSVVSDCRDTEMLALDNAPECHMAVVPAGYSHFGAGAGDELVPVTAMKVFNPPEPTSKMRALVAAESSQNMIVDVASSSSSSSSSEEEARALPPKEKFKSVRVGENMLTILLKLLSRASGKSDSFNPDDCKPQSRGPDEKPHPASDSRVGDMAFHIEKVLHKICKLDPSCRDFILQMKRKLWPEEARQKATEEEHRKERAILAQKRRSKMLEELAKSSQKFKQIVEESAPTEEDMELDQQTSSANLYICTICSKTSASTEEEPMGLVALVQTTIALGFSKNCNAKQDSLPLCEEECAALQKSLGNNLMKDFGNRFEQLKSIFGSECELTMDLRGKGGVHVLTCGHHIHVKCLREYLDSLKASTNKPTNLNIEKGEFACPLCRQLCNTVVPLAVESDENYLKDSLRVSKSVEISMYLQDIPPVPERKSAMDDAMQRAMHDVINCSSETWNLAKLDEPSLLALTNSALRTNLEIQVAQRGDTLRMPDESDSAAEARRACFVPFMQVLSHCTKTVATSPVWPVWHRVAGLDPMVGHLHNGVPILLRNPTALLVQFLLLLPPRLEQSHFTCIIRALYNLQYFECLLQLLCSLSMEEISSFNFNMAGWSSDLTTLYGCASLLMFHFPPDCGLLNNTAKRFSDKISHLSDLEAEVQKLCLPFLRVAALLRHDLYRQPIPEIPPGTGGFVQLVHFLELCTNSMNLDTFNAATALNWEHHVNPPVRVMEWLHELLTLVFEGKSEMRDLVHQHKLWNPPRLLQMPITYDPVFQFYHKRECTTCGTVPHELSLCLFCAKTICLKGPCCKKTKFETVEHSFTCGGGTGIFLVVPSSYIIVVRGSRACLWGSVYLDTYGEEDRDLKRGRPLYLSEARMNLLEQQWLMHKFDHINKKWVYHRDSL
ncbi:E3 ubiquitin-protein ligase Ubr3 [Cloeon dipterum]|uniref:E3 ubiquitin-protein ligase Ubr3 n=1 Tax=Cloeon dipterum TaxID=197152 RepID=UPI00321FF090